MADLPTGEWSALLVGHQWPDSGTLGSLLGAAAHRGDLARAFDDYGNTLRGVRATHLDPQDGKTAEEIRQLFQRGEARVREISATSQTKQKAYRSARRCAEDLRADLADIAAAGNAAIRGILDSDAPTAQKVSAIVETVTTAQLDANSRAAVHSAGVFEAIQCVLDAHGEAASAREFARTNGVDLLKAFGSPDQDALRTSVGLLVDPEASTESPTGPVTGRPPLPATTPVDGSAGIAVDAPGSASPVAIAAGGTSGNDGPNLGGGPNQPVAPTAIADSPASTTGPGHTGAASEDGARPPNGIAAAVPLAASVEALAVAAASDGTGEDGPSPGVPTPAEPAASAAAAPTTVLVGPPGPPSVHAPVTPVPGSHPGPLHGYGADLRPPTTTAPSPPAAFPPAPGAPTAATGATPGPTANPALVSRRARQRAVAATAVTERPVATDPTAHHPAHRLLAAVARQQPRLRWAIGERPGGDMVLLTDLAGGWIPPGIAVPVGLELPAPGRGGTDLKADMDTIVGSATLVATHEPGQPLAPVADADPVPTSASPRWAPTVDDLGWELSRATKWRDGLPRLTHTLARALAAQTGWLDSEIALLRRHLEEVAEAVLGDYPGDVPAAGVGNWQLLSAVEAAIDDEKELAEYHFSWFSAQTCSSRGRRR
ncbi:MAG: DUF5631 domain-containing protein [Mycobacterium sp.]|nr:DUF5631 domain-containing protein [Mycobacterium sp.]